MSNLSPEQFPNGPERTGGVTPQTWEKARQILEQMDVPDFADHDEAREWEENR